MKHNVESFKKYYINATKEEVIEDMFLDNCNLQQEIERLTKQNKALNEMYELTKKEYIRINNIINELEKYFEQEGFWHSLDKIKELRELTKEDKKIEKIPKKDKNGDIYLYSNEALEIIDKLNEIIDYINKEE